MSRFIQAAYVEDTSFFHMVALTIVNNVFLVKPALTITKSVRVQFELVTLECRAPKFRDDLRSFVKYL
jgi:hypothetical protein